MAQHQKVEVEVLFNFSLGEDERGDGRAKEA